MLPCSDGVLSKRFENTFLRCKCYGAHILNVALYFNIILSPDVFCFVKSPNPPKDKHSYNVMLPPQTLHLGWFVSIKSSSYSTKYNNHHYGQTLQLLCHQTQNFPKIKMFSLCVYLQSAAFRIRISSSLSGLLPTPLWDMLHCV